MVKTAWRSLAIACLGIMILVCGLVALPGPGAPFASPLQQIDAPLKKKKMRPAAVRTVPNYASLKASMTKFISRYPGMTYGVYFKDLTTGASFGIHDDWVFPAASTIKVPLVLYLNELVDAGKLSWQHKVIYSSDLDWQGGAGCLQFFAQDGDKYSLRVLANLTITISDNISTRMILRHLGKNNFINYLKSTGAKVVYPNGENKSTPRDMALYVETAVNYAKTHADGKRLLDDMANPIWHVGLPGKLPELTKVAHKEGDLVGVVDDIGIVYSRRPYIIAVMTTGVTNEYVAWDNISSLSKLAYDFQEKLAAS